MADGTQSGFNFPPPRASQLRAGEIVVDLFAGGGGASEGLEQALGRPVDLAYNHDRLAVGMHAANHPLTIHKREDIWVADPRAEVGLRPVGWFHASPDCTHFSQAKGGQPRKKATRALSWVVVKWVGSLARTGNAPRIISLENVKQILQWGPLVAKRDKATGRVMKLDGTVASPGERVSVWEQALVPDKRHAGRTWAQFVHALRAYGYVVEWRVLKACDFGAGTSRERLFLLARRDGEAVRWPEPTHGPGREHPYVTAADCIDWSVPCPSIFNRGRWSWDKKKREWKWIDRALADATLRRIAKGIHRYVLGSAEPFIVPVTHTGDRRAHPAGEPVPTITGANRGEFAVISPILAGVGGRAGQSEPRRGDETLYTFTSKYDTAVVAPVLVQAGHGEGKGPSKRRSHGINDPQGPIGTIVASGGGHAIAAATLVQTGYGERPGQQPRVPGLGKPLGTLVDGQKHAAVAAHLIKFRGQSQGADVADPVPTITSGAGAKRPAGAAHAMGVVTAHMAKLRGTSSAADVVDPLATVSAGGEHHALVEAHLTAFGQNAKGTDPREPMQTALGGATRFGVVECTLSPEHEAGALRVAAFLVKYYGTALGVDITDPLDTVTTRDRLALVTVTIKGTPYVIVDIGLRMLRREELFRAQGFPADYIIDRTADGTPLSISASVRMVGNSVSPPPIAALARANLDPVDVSERMAA